MEESDLCEQSETPPGVLIVVHECGHHLIEPVGPVMTSFVEDFKSECFQLVHFYTKNCLVGLKVADVRHGGSKS